jgi:4-alpha-glucanotransferase
MGRRASGILLHPTSLPGPYGIGDLGESARRFLPWLQQAGQKIWQMLPLVPAGAGHSPYDGASAFASNPWLVSPVDLVNDRLLRPSDLQPAPSFDPRRVDYEAVGAWKSEILTVAWNRFRSSADDLQKERLETWASSPEQDAWLDDWALFASLKQRFEGRPWPHWPEELRSRNPDALETARRELADEMGFHKFVQYVLSLQWARLRTAARQSGVRLFGDMPFYVALDSADVWAHRRLFDVTAEGQPRRVAGVPPDYFSETGQRWGNPLFSWDRHQEEGYLWWTQRVGFALQTYDQVRIDHFRAFASFWEIDAREPTAIHGHWVPGPGLALFDRLRQELGELPLVAEDLGHITEDVRDLKLVLGFPGMRVFQFGFDAHDSEHLPHNFTHDTVAYTGTHDNDTLVGWLEGIDDDRHRAVLDYVGSDGEAPHWDVIRSLLTSVAEQTVFPIQDVLGLGTRHRMNTPGTTCGNWTWRLEPERVDARTAERLRHLSILSGRQDPEAQGSTW